MLISLDFWTTRYGNHLVCCLKTSLWRDLPLPKMLWKMSNGNALGLFGMILKMKKIIPKMIGEIESNINFILKCFLNYICKTILNICIFIHRDDTYMHLKHYVNLDIRRVSFYPYHSPNKNLLFNIAFISCKVMLWRNWMMEKNKNTSF